AEAVDAGDNDAFSGLKARGDGDDAAGGCFDGHGTPVDDGGRFIDDPDNCLLAIFADGSFRHSDPAFILDAENGGGGGAEPELVGFAIDTDLDPPCAGNRMRLGRDFAHLALNLDG